MRLICGELQDVKFVEECRKKDSGGQGGSFEYVHVEIEGHQVQCLSDPPIFHGLKICQEHPLT